MNKKLAIKGHPTRGKEVIELLEMMGGNTFNSCMKIAYSNRNYYIGNNNAIAWDYIGLEEIDKYVIFTLEEFWEKYPFKIGDKVIDKADGCPGVVCEMKWDEGVSDMKYYVAFGNGVDFGWFANDSIEFCKENEKLEETQSNQDIDKDVFRKEFCECCGSQRCSGQDDELEDCERFKNLMDNSGTPFDKTHKMGSKSKLPSKYYEDKLEEIKSKREYDELRMPLDDDDKLATEATIMDKKILPPDGYLVGKITRTDNGMLVEYVDKKIKYPKLTNLSECKEILGEKDMYQGVSGYKGELLTNFQRLLIFRDVYWKIAGEEMGLGKPWDSTYGSGEWGYWLGYDVNENKIYLQDSRILVNHTLVFPTEEMRDVFYKNFKDLIECCKELL